MMLIGDEPQSYPSYRDIADACRPMEAAQLHVRFRAPFGHRRVVRLCRRM